MFGCFLLSSFTRNVYLGINHFDLQCCPSVPTDRYQTGASLFSSLDFKAAAGNIQVAFELTFFKYPQG